MKFLLTLPFFAMPITLWINVIILFNTNDDEKSFSILSVISLIAVCFHLIWTIVLLFKKNIYGATILVNLQIKFILFILYFAIYILGMVYFIASPFVIMITKTESPLLFGIIYAFLVNMTLFLLSSIPQFCSIIKMYKQKEINKTETIIYSIGSWIFIVSFIVGIIACCKHFAVKNTVSTITEQTSEVQE